MPNGKPGDDPYHDIIVHKLDIGEPEAAKRVRALHALADPDVEHLVVDLVNLMLPIHRPRNDYYSKIVVKHLDTIYRLATSRSLSS
jgi:hypothetical protein